MRTGGIAVQACPGGLPRVKGRPVISGAMSLLSSATVLRLINSMAIVLSHAYQLARVHLAWRVQELRFGGRNLNGRGNAPCPRRRC